MAAACGSGREAASGAGPSISGVYASSYEHGPIYLTLVVVNGQGTFFRVQHGLALGYTFGSARVSGDTLFLASNADALDRQQAAGCDSVTAYPETAMMGCISPVEEHFFESSDTLLVHGDQLALLSGSLTYRRVDGSRLGAGS